MAESYHGYRKSGLVNITDNKIGTAMLDKMSRVSDLRRTQPLNYYENVFYTHRAYFDNFNIMIGDALFLIPPEFIMVNSEANSPSVVTLRQENTQKEKVGHHRRTILIDLVFNGTNQLNGFKVPAPKIKERNYDNGGYYYMDGLRQLLAQFKCTPILPVTNELLNSMYNIYTVALQSITISTIDGFPDAMTAQITLQEVCMFPYIEMPDITFQYMIDWDLFRYYYQRFTTEEHLYKRLQSLPENKEHNHFKMSILDNSLFAGGEGALNMEEENGELSTRPSDDKPKANEYNILDIIKDKKNYITWIDSEKSDCTITSFQAGYSNLLTNIQLEDHATPTVQFLGGMDTIFNIQFETKDYTVVQSIEQLQVTNDMVTRNNGKLRSSIGFIMLESELTEFCGALYVMIESCATNTVPGMPGLYNIQLNCVAYDMSQSEREDLDGFRPFPGKGDMPMSELKKQVITQDKDGLIKKIKQDNYAEWRLRTNIEVYPDLRLPTYNEVDAALSAINSFRKEYEQKKLPYSSYPKQPMCMVHGINPFEDTVTGTYNNHIMFPEDVNAGTKGIYDVYVDPDFYVFYPDSYTSFGEEDPEYYSGVQPPQRSGYTKQKTKKYNYLTSPDGTVGASGMADQFVEKAISLIGHTYVLGAEGEISDSKGMCFDCSGLVHYCMKAVGAAPSYRFTVSDIPSMSEFREVPFSERQRGDLLVQGDLKHVTICEGGGSIVHASSSKKSVTRSNEYSALTRCFRIKAFEQAAASSGGSVAPLSASGATNEEKLWNTLKSCGLTDIAAAGIVGNVGRETGGTFDPRIVEGGTYSDSVPSKGGYGLFQYTYSGYKTGLKSYCANNGVGVNTMEGQVGYLMSVIQGASWFSQLQNAKTPAEASNIFMNKFEKPGVPAAGERIKYAENAYNKYAGKSDGTGSSGPTLTTTEFNEICKAVCSETMGESSKSEKAMAQVIYDRLTSGSYGGLSNILYNSEGLGTFADTLTDTVEDNVRAVFCNNDKYWPDYMALSYLTPDAPDSGYKNKSKQFDRLGTVDKHTYWGRKRKGSDTKYTISDAAGAGSASSNESEVSTDVTHDAYTCDDISRFGMPIILQTDYEAQRSDGDINIFANDIKNHFVNDVNSTDNVFYTSFVDEYQYSCRARFVKAFPSFLFCLLDDQANWYQANKLWTNYYTHKSVVDIQVHETNDMPTATATLVVNNSFHNLDRTQGGLSGYNIAEDKGYSELQRGLYKWFGTMVGGIKLTDMLIELHSIIYTHARLREGARVHLRMGYGSDPLSLAPMINGHISEVSLGNQISIIVTSDGHELINSLTSASSPDAGKNNGFLGLFGLGSDQEGSNIIAQFMCERESWANHISQNWGEGSKYGIEHFGLFNNEGAALFTNYFEFPEQYDIMKNVYKANYHGDLYHHISGWFSWDDETNVVFTNYNMTPWDVFQCCTQNVPEYILKPSYHQFDSRLFYGLPFMMEKYRYDWINGEAAEEAKSSTQVHYLDSLTNIIDDRVRVTSRFSNTNIKVMYQRGSSAVTTQTIHSDSTIDFDKQKTTILDSPIVQDALGPDLLYELIGYDVGDDSARRTGISNLLYGWQQQYQGEILCLGCPGVKAHDYLMVNDIISNLFGVCIVREVIHSFGVNTGFTTGIVPGMIGFSQDENSGLIETTQNYLMMASLWASYTSQRRGLKTAYEANFALFGQLKRAELESMATFWKGSLGSGIETGWGAIHTGLVGAGLVVNGVRLYNISKDIYSCVKMAQKGAKLAAAANKVFKTAGGVVKGIRYALSLGKAGSVAAAPETFGASLVVTVVLFIVEALVDELLEWASNRNVIKLLPMWWENYPFASGIQGGEHILLIPAGGSDEKDDGLNPNAEGND